jgi:hypothetical protein
MSDRTPRHTETREKAERRKGWTRPSVLPTPDPREGLTFRWVRTSTLGNSDNTNVSSRFRQGYTPVKAKDFPELQVVSDFDSRFKDNIEVGGLLLCSIPTEIVEERIEGQLEMARNAEEAVDRNFMRENDSRMPVLRPERSTRTSFGK